MSVFLYLHMATALASGPFGGLAFSTDFSCAAAIVRLFGMVGPLGKPLFGKPLFIQMASFLQIRKFKKISHW